MLKIHYYNIIFILKHSIFPLKTSNIAIFEFSLIMLAGSLFPVKPIFVDTILTLFLSYVSKRMRMLFFLHTHASQNVSTEVSENNQSKSCV